MPQLKTLCTSFSSQSNSLCVHLRLGLFLNNVSLAFDKNSPIGESEPLADLGGGVRDARPPLGVQILSISCSFRENLACSRPPWRVHAPPRENPGSATVNPPPGINRCSNAQEWQVHKFLAGKHQAAVAAHGT